MEYSEYLQTDYWKAVADAVKKRDGYRCVICNSRDSLVAHHRSYAHRGNELDHLDDLSCMCRPCHENFHQVQIVDGTRKATRMPLTFQAAKSQEKPKLVFSYAKQTKQAKAEKRRLKRERKMAQRQLSQQRAINEMLAQAQNNQAKYEQRIATSTKREEKAKKASEWRAYEAKREEVLSSLYNHEADMPAAFPAKLDQELILRFRTKAGGYTSKTLVALGVPTPPVSGWPAKLVGVEISREACMAALQGRESKSTLATLKRINHPLVSSLPLQPSPLNAP